MTADDTGTSTGDEGRLRQALQTIAERSAPVRLPEDLWSRGKRRRRRRVAATLAVAAVILAVMVALPAMLTRGLFWTAPVTQPRPAVPGTVHPPLPWQRSAQDSPIGPASILITGNGPFAGSDLFGYEDHGMVVGLDGFYRLVRYNTGAELLLSPDGRYVAGDSSMEDSSVEVSNSGRMWTSVLDLSTGLVRSYDVGTPVAWSPDGRLLTRDDSLRVLDVRTGDARAVFRPPYDAPDGSYVAFSPDGRSLAAVSGRTIYVVDLADGHSRALADLGEGGQFAGVGGWTSTGLIATWDVHACDTACAGGDPDAKLFRTTYVDAETGARAQGPLLDAVAADGVRLLGWQPDGSAVVHIVHSFSPTTGVRVPEWSELVALLPGGGRTKLVELPSGALGVDVARDLIDQGSFGGPAPSLVARSADLLASRLAQVAFLAAGVAGIIIAVRWRRRAVSRRRRDGFSPPPQPEW